MAQRLRQILPRCKRQNQTRNKAVASAHGADHLHVWRARHQPQALGDQHIAFGPAGDQHCLCHVAVHQFGGEIDAGGQGEELKGKIIRIAHMGCLDEYDILTGISCLEKVLKVLISFLEILLGHLALKYNTCFCQ